MYRLKYVGRKIFPPKFRIVTYKENVWVIDGIVDVEYESTKNRLLKEGFVEINIEIPTPIEEKELPKTKKKTKKTK